MGFRIKALEDRTINGKQWILCEGSLADYLDNLKSDFYDFAIQRRIVRNQYLDSIYKTIRNGEPIPILTLTYKAGLVSFGDDNVGQLEMNEVEILDGLQRTFRLWSYLKISDKFIEQPLLNPRGFVADIKRDPIYELMFDSGVISTRIIRELMESNEILGIRRIFSEFKLYFIIWVGLTDSEIVRKMLVLNAGQKQVSKVHQFELLFLHVWDDIKDGAQIKIRREKDETSTAIKKGNRVVGEFMFSSIIVSLMSLIEKKPMRVSTEKLLAEENEEDPDSDLYQRVFSAPFISAFLSKLFDLDEKIIASDEVYGRAWFVKDTTLSGVFAAIGKSAEMVPSLSADELIDRMVAGFNRFSEIVENQGLSLSNFQAEYDSFSSRSVNIGNHIRKVVAQHVESMLLGQSATWSDSFGKIKEGN